MFNKFVDERLQKITKLDKKKLILLMHKYKGSTTDAKFNEFDNVINLIDKIRGGETRLADAKNDQAKCKSSLAEIEKVNKKTYIKRENNTLYNIEMLYKARNGVIKFLIIILERYLKRNMKQPKEHDLKY